MRGPVGADGAQQPAQEGSDLLAAGPFGGTKNGGDEAAGAVEHDDRLKSVFVIMGVEQPQLLAAVNGVERVVDVEGDPLGNLRRTIRNRDRPRRGPCAASARASGRFSSRSCLERSSLEGQSRPKPRCTTVPQTVPQSSAHVGCDFGSLPV